MYTFLSPSPQTATGSPRHSPRRRMNDSGATADHASHVDLTHSMYAAVKAAGCGEGSAGGKSMTLAVRK